MNSLHTSSTNELFSYQAKRAQLARLGITLGSTSTYALCTAVSTLLILGGLYVAVVLSLSLGWLLAGLSGPFIMAALWGKHLVRLQPQSDSATVDALLEPNVLGRIPKHPTPRKVAEAVSHTNGGLFFTNRYLLSGTLLVSLASDNEADMTVVWQAALDKRAALKTSEVSTAMLTAALIENVPNINEYLAHVGVDTKDINEGVAWYHHYIDLIALHKQRRQAGGIGRDWAFGFTPMLERFAHNISEQVNAGGIITRELDSHEQIIGHVMEVLAQSGRRNVALVGQLGSGKTKLVHAFAEKVVQAKPGVPRSLQYAQVMALDPSTLIARAPGRGELEQLVQQLCVEALKAKNVVLFLDDAQLFFEEGTGSVDLSNVLLPFLEGGALRIVMALDEQRWTQITQRNPGLAQYMNRVVVLPANEQETMEVMQNQAILLENQYDVLFTYQAMQAAQLLSSRYVAEQVMPGRALALLESAAHFAKDHLVMKESVEKAIEQTQGIKVATANTDDERETLLHLEERIHERMINQSYAVKAVSDALRRARAGVRNPGRPIGTFLFLGPTGVGKTELAKSVAAVFFNDETNLIRLDLNEYVRSEDVSRLIADPAKDSHSLTAQVSRKPFSVILLDEIEKAHPEVLNTLLQVLDEGMLRDINNREVSFRDAVIIATSNAGADKIRAHIEAGEQLEQFEQQFLDELINSNIFRPEFLNRFDETVLFRPLTKEELLQVVDIILSGVNKTLAAQKLTVQVADDAKRLLVDAGYDPRLGARPMRRVVQRTVENIVSNQVLSQQAVPGSTIQVAAADVQAMLGK